jgi:transglutaminase-like putative cysteine protease
MPATVALTVVTAVTAHSFGRVFAGGDLVRQLVVLAIMVHAAAFGLRATRLTAWAAVPLTYGLVLVLVARSHHPDTLTAGWVPSTATIRAIGADLEVVWREFPTALVPVPDSGPFAMLAALSVGVVAATADLFGFRAEGRVEALMPATVVFVALAGVTARDSRIGLAAVWLFCAFVALALLRAVHGERTTTVVGPAGQRTWVSRFGLAAGMAGVATVAALTVAPRMPGAGDDALVDARREGNEVTEVVSPLVDIRSRLVERSSRVLFHVSATAPAYWRLTSLARFNGTTWGLVDDDLDDTVAPLASAAGTTVSQTFEIDALGGPLAPAAFSPTEVSGGDLAYVADTATLVATGDGLSNGLRYAVTSVVPAPTPELLATASSTSPPDPVYLELPDDFPNELRTLAAEITAGSTGPYAQALALQTYFRAFDYTIDTPPGHSDDAMVAFIERRSGYCEQFAGTFAAFARAIGLPARVAVGFTPGGTDLSGRYEVKGRNAHAWPEVWFDGIGWLSFEPTPGRGQPGADVYTNVPPAQAPSGTDGDGADTGTTPSTVARAPGMPTIPPGELGPTGEPAAVPDGAGAPRITPAGGDGSSVALWVMGILGLVGTWALAMPPLVQWVVRRRRRQPAERVVGAWSAAATALGLVGAACRPSDTPIEHANRAARLTGFDPVTLRELAVGATAAVYSPRAVDSSTASRCERLRRYVVTNAREFTPWSSRVRARLDPRMAARLA